MAIIQRAVTVRTMRPDRVRRHMLGIGPGPARQMSRVINKDRAGVEWPRLQQAWVKAVPHQGRTATITATDVDPDYVRVTIRLDPDS